LQKTNALTNVTDNPVSYHLHIVLMDMMILLRQGNYQWHISIKENGWQGEQHWHGWKIDFWCKSRSVFKVILDAEPTWQPSTALESASKQCTACHHATILGKWHHTTTPMDI
jgi:hypothetical protein